MLPARRRTGDREVGLDLGPLLCAVVSAVERSTHARFFFSLDPLTDPLTDGVGEPGDLAPLLLALAMAAADAASALGQLDSSSRRGG